LCRLQKFVRQAVEDGDLAVKVWTPDHADPADRATGDDESPEAAQQAAEGHADPPPSPQPEEPAASAGGAPLRVTPLSVRPPATSASAPRVEKRTTAQIEAVLKKKRQMTTKRVPEVAG
jgi:hypothetical protein